VRVLWNIGVVAVALVGAAAPGRGPGAPLEISFWNAREGVAAFERAVGWTDDGGRTWHVRARARLGAITVVPGTHDAWADGATGLVHSRDGGRTWARAVARVFRATFVDRRRGWAFRPGAIRAGPLLATRDGGRTWRGLGRPCPPRAMDAAASFVSARRGWLLCTGQPGTGMQNKALYETGDGGRRWRLVMDAWLVGNHATPRGIGTVGYARGIDFDRSGAGWLWETRGGAFATADGGRTWRLLPFWEPDIVEARSMSFVSARVSFLLLRDGRHRRYALERTADAGRTWRLVHAWPMR
jgi:photosystem II stability/assembly factor-like uncharacterized protein